MKIQTPKERWAKEVLFAPSSSLVKDAFPMASSTTTRGPEVSREEERAALSAKAESVITKVFRKRSEADKRELYDALLSVSKRFRTAHWPATPVAGAEATSAVSVSQFVSLFEDCAAADNFEAYRTLNDLGLSASLDKVSSARHQRRRRHRQRQGGRSGSGDGGDGGGKGRGHRGRTQQRPASAHAGGRRGKMLPSSSSVCLCDLTVVRDWLARLTPSFTCLLPPPPPPPPPPTHTLFSIVCTTQRDRDRRKLQADPLAMVAQAKAVGGLDSQELDSARPLAGPRSNEGWSQAIHGSTLQKGSCQAGRRC